MSQAPPTDESQGRSRSVLEEEREFFLRSLRDLEAERAAGDIDELDYQALHDDYTVRAAHVLRQLAFLDGTGPNPDGAPPPADPTDVAGGSAGFDGPSGAGQDGAPGTGHDATVDDGSEEESETETENDAAAARRPSPWRKRVLTVIAALLIVGGATWAVAAFAGVRLPGEEVSGANSSQQATQLVVNAETAEADNNPALALKDCQDAINKDADNTEALTGEGAILVEAGASGNDRSLVDEGIADLGKAEIVDPSYGSAYGYRGLGYYYEGSYQAAVGQLETYVADTPAKSRISSISSILTQAKAKLAKSG